MFKFIVLLFEKLLQKKDSTYTMHCFFFIMYNQRE